MPEFQFQEMFPSHEDTTSYRKLTSDFVGTAKFNGQRRADGRAGGADRR